MRQTTTARPLRLFVLVALTFSLLVAVAPPALASPVCTDGYMGGPPRAQCGGRVFPEAELAQSYIQYAANPATGFREYQHGLEYLAQLYPRWISVFTFSDHFGDPEAVTAGPDEVRPYEEGDTGDGHEILVIKITDHEIPDEGKETLFFSLSVHGNERGGLEGGVRTAEDLAMAAEDGGTIVDGYDNYESTTGREAEFHEYEVADVLAEEAVYLVDFNIDGWTQGDFYHVPSVPYGRGNSIGTDLNRQMPTVGSINTSRNPLQESEMAYGLDFMEDVAALGRQDLMAYAADVHGELTSNAYIDIMYPAGQFDSVDHRRLMAIAERTKSVVDETLYEGIINQIEESAGGNQGEPPNVIPTKPAHWATVWDTLGYTDTGFIGDYMATDLAVTGMDYEIFLNHTVPDRNWNVYLQENHINGTRAIIKTAMAYALTQSQEFNAGNVVVDPVGRAGYVFNPDTVTDTDENGSGTLPGPNGDGIGADGKPVEQRSYEATPMRWFGDTSELMGDNPFVAYTPEMIAEDPAALDAVDTLVLADVPLPGATALEVSPPQGEPAPAQEPISASATLLAPGGGARVGGVNSTYVEFDVEPGQGSLSALVTNPGTNDVDLYLQRQAEDGSYDGDAAEGTNSSLSEESLALVDPEPGHYRLELHNWAGPAGTPAQVEITFAQDEPEPTIEEVAGPNADLAEDYYANIGDWVQRGGNLVLTDRALHAAPEIGLFDAEAVSDIEVYQPYSDIQDFEHPMVEGLRPNARQLVEAAILGYCIGDSCSPMTAIDEQAFTDAGGEVVATTGDGLVTIGQAPVGDGIVRIVGGALPTPTEQYDHRYGLRDYGLTYSGLYVMENSIRHDVDGLGEGPVPTQPDTDLPGDGDDGDGDGSGDPDVPVPPQPGTEDEVARVAGRDRIQTALEVSAGAFADGEADGVVLARADEFPDALAGTPLAVAEDAPLLLTPPDRLDTNVEAELRRVLDEGGTVTLLGGTAALSPAVEQRVADLGYEVERYAGSNRFETAALIAERGLGAPETMLVASGAEFPDAVAAGAAAGHAGGAVLLSDGERMPDETSSYLDRHAGERFAVGGPAATADPAAEPLVGATRFETALAVAEQFFDQPQAVGIATGRQFADALSGGALMARLGGPLLLSEPDALPATVSDYLTERADDINRALLFGGTAALSDDVQTAVEQAVTAG